MRKNADSLARRRSQDIALRKYNQEKGADGGTFFRHHHNYHCFICGQFLFGGYCEGGSKCTFEPTEMGSIDVYNDPQYLCLACMTKK